MEGQKAAGNWDLSISAEDFKETEGFPRLWGNCFASCSCLPRISDENDLVQTWEMLG